MNDDSVSELKRSLQELEDSMMERNRVLEERRQTARSLNAETSELRQSLNASEASKDSFQHDFRSTARQKQVLDNEEKKFKTRSSSLQTREELVSQSITEENKQKAAEEEVRTLSSQINGLRETKTDAQKRLTVFRLITMLEDLRVSLSAKVQTPNADENAEERAQELLKAIQELSRERERALMQLTKKEREMNETILLKKKRIEDLQREADKNVAHLRESNDFELLGVAERIQCERAALINDIERIQETNLHLARVIQDTKLSSDGATIDRGNALSSNEAMCTSRDPVEETKELREKIAAASTERRRLMEKTRIIENRIHSEAEKYQIKMSEMKKDLLTFQKESSQLEEENRALKITCDTLAVALQS